MKTGLKNILKEMCLFMYGGILYLLIEIVWRGWTHPVMAAVGGLAFLFLYHISMTLTIKNRFIRALFGAFCVTLIELGSGIIINIWLEMSVWDYSQRTLNFWGQICLLYFFLWFLLCLALDEIFVIIKKRKN